MGGSTGLGESNGLAIPGAADAAAAAAAADAVVVADAFAADPPPGDGATAAPSTLDADCMLRVLALKVPGTDKPCSLALTFDGVPADAVPAFTIIGGFLLNRAADAAGVCSPLFLRTRGTEHQKQAKQPQREKEWVSTPL